MEKVLEIELGKILAAFNVLEGGVDEPNSIKNLNLKFSGKTAFKLSLLKSKLRDLANSAEETRTNLIKEKYGEQDETGNYAVKTEEKFNGFLKEYSEVLNTKHKISFMPLKFEDFENVEGLPLEFTDILIYFFE